MIPKAYSPTEISTIIDAETFVEINDCHITELLIDSRKLTNSKETIFFALLGAQHNGHHYIDDLYNRGVRNFVVSEILSELPGANVYKVSNTLLALQKLAVFHRSGIDVETMGITGSNGKTTVKEWLYQLLSDEKKIVRNPRSYNSQVGVPLSVWNLHAGCELAIFEAGISRPGEMERLAPIIQPTEGIFTNIGEAHQKNFTSLHQKALEKCALFTHVKTLFYCKDQPVVNKAIETALPHVNKRTWGKHAKSDLQILATKETEKGVDIFGNYQGKEYSIFIPFKDKASIENACHCWLYLLVHNFDSEWISAQMKTLEPVAMRLEQKEGRNQTILINDSYNSDINSLEIALSYLNQVNSNYPKALILSDIVESGQDKSVLYQQVAQMVKRHDITRLFGIGPHLTEAAPMFSVEAKEFFTDTDNFLQQLPGITFSKEIILIKGARRFGFERITKMLQRQSHQTRLEVNLDALVHNYNFYRNLLSPGVRTMVMVKAFAYGIGSLEIARVLVFHGVDYLGVAYADEGVSLRSGGITSNIMVMNPQESDFVSIINNRLEPEVYSFEMLEAFSKVVAESADLVDYPIHIKLDTGMNRLGFKASDLPELLHKLADTKNLRIASVFSHLVASDEVEHDAFTQKQIRLFRKYADEIEASVGYKMLRHISNSAGIKRFPAAQFDMVRLGIGLYGIGADQQSREHLLPVSTLKSTIVQVKKVKAGETIGYSRKGATAENITIAIIPVGYADGLDRRLGNGKGAIFVHGKKCPIVGNICMDLTMVDVSAIPAKVNDEVEIFGPNITLLSMAEVAGTIPYEIIAGIPQRVKRVYFREDT